MKKNKKLVIFGLESTAKMAHFYFERDTEYEVCAFTADDAFIKASSYLGLPTAPFSQVETLYPPSEYEMFVAIGYNKMNKIREQKYYEAKTKGYKLPNYISPRCNFLTSEPIGDNNFIMEDNTIQPFVTIGNNNVFWSGNHIGHETQIGDHCFVTSHVVISGFVKVKNNCFFGVNATIRDAIIIETESLIAAGAIIMKSTEPRGVYVPARTVKLEKTSDQITIS
ncbi:MAG: acetyltransferase [Bacteroidia bacterium]|nr:acetyltransferase [Bacteroidia bacterium]MDW8335174.1 acetyltransferase [Bacteroidia bacterium]